MHGKQVQAVRGMGLPSSATLLRSSLLMLSAPKGDPFNEDDSAALGQRALSHKSHPWISSPCCTGTQSSSIYCTNPSERSSPCCIGSQTEIHPHPHPYLSTRPGFMQGLQSRLYIVAFDPGSLNPGKHLESMPCPHVLPLLWASFIIPFPCIASKCLPSLHLLPITLEDSPASHLLWNLLLKMPKLE